MTLSVVRDEHGFLQVLFYVCLATKILNIN